MHLFFLYPIEWVCVRACVCMRERYSKMKVLVYITSSLHADLSWGGGEWERKHFLIRDEANAGTPAIKSLKLDCQLMTSIPSSLFSTLVCLSPPSSSPSSSFFSSPTFHGVFLSLSLTHSVLVCCDVISSAPSGISLTSLSCPLNYMMNTDIQSLHLLDQDPVSIIVIV